MLNVRYLKSNPAKLPYTIYQLRNPIETHQGKIQRYQFIYLMSQHFSSTILGAGNSTVAFEHSAESRLFGIERESILHNSDNIMENLFELSH